MSEKGELVDKLKQKIVLQNKQNVADKRKCRISSLAALILMVILAVQVVQSNSYLRNLVTFKNAQVKSTELIDQGSKIATEVSKESTKFVEEKVKDTQKWYDDKKEAAKTGDACASLRVELSNAAIELTKSKKEAELLKN